MCFAEGIKLVTKSTLNRHVLLGMPRPTSQQERELEAQKYKDVCAALPEELFDACLAHTFAGLLGVLRSHHCMLSWIETAHAAALADTDERRAEHARAQVALDEAPPPPTPPPALAPAQSDGANGDGGDDECRDEAEVEAQAEAEAEAAAAAALAAAAYRNDIAERKRVVDAAAAQAEAAAERVKRLWQVRAAVAQARVSVWDLMQRRVAVFLSSAPMNSFTVEQFLDVFGGVFRFIDVGEAFSGAGSLGLKARVPRPDLPGSPHPRPRPADFDPFPLPLADGDAFQGQGVPGKLSPRAPRRAPHASRDRDVEADAAAARVESRRSQGAQTSAA